MKKNNLLEAVTELVSRIPQGKLLDMGCGDGEYSLKLFDKGFDVTASDMDSKRFKYADKIPFIKADLGDVLPFPDESFDVLLFLEVIEHLRNPFAVMAEISRVLKKGGVLIISTPNILNLSSRVRFLFQGSYDFFREPPLEFSRIMSERGSLQNMHVIPWRYHDLEYLLSENSLKVTSIYADIIKGGLKVLSLLFFLPARIYSLIKERKIRRSGGADPSRINSLLFSKELLCGRHLIAVAEKM